MRRLESCWDTADGMDKEKEEEGDDWFLGEAKGMHDLEDWKKKKSIIVKHTNKIHQNSLGAGCLTFFFFLGKVRRGRYICIEAMGLAVGELRDGRNRKEEKKGKAETLIITRPKCPVANLVTRLTCYSSDGYPFESPLVRLVPAH